MEPSVARNNPWCNQAHTLILDFTLCLSGSRPQLFVYRLYYAPVQAGIDFPLIAKFREVGYTTMDLKLLNSITVITDTSEFLGMVL